MRNGQQTGAAQGLIGGAEPPLRPLDNSRHIFNVAMFDDSIFSYSSR